MGLILLLLGALLIIAGIISIIFGVIRIIRRSLLALLFLPLSAALIFAGITLFASL